MRAITYIRYGAPDVLKLAEIEKPVPCDNEVLVKIKASTVTPMDWKFRSGNTLIARLMTGIIKPKINILGVEFSGEIEETGKDISKFKIGDMIFGRAKKAGAYAEYLCVPEKEICLNPSNASFGEAAGITFGATTALFGLTNTGNIQQGQKVLINGASGGVGLFAVQLAKFHGAKVTAVCSSTNHKMVIDSGADIVIDYMTTDFTKNGEIYDIVFDCVGKRTYSDCKKSLVKHGVYISTVLSFPLLIQMFSSSIFGRKKGKFIFSDFKPDDLLMLKDLYEKKIIKTVIDKTYSLKNIRDAHHYAEKGHVKGKVIVEI
ncbi:MAG: NAD(P)-dependent alcohol dehydrogenase [Bacteroidetes bacterium]|jgi:NADPH:quinone reductase-like Zn-dependent oxidoreductase|nr:NAD(P)-dependent alcohol dehydrogenase [Bacteroidota bacterium]MBT4410673.1 NAD(P)-dependent alcohol dehydrogenase [Bacteroidota bacterium]MBT6046677.1 NAD(P)-dependent alcohol dehydrogenase [Candidatus Scalindua sp.]MBT7464262.1 NAD(P)-dependent alcohol dehydrogenase [Bacteroidota bacterium]